MKTSELRKWLDEKDWSYQEDLNCIIVGAFKRVIVMRNSYGIEIGSINIMNERSLDLFKKLIEYCETPLNEREDEKKYYIHQKIDNRFLSYVLTEKFYIMFEPTNVDGFQTQFTQSEIDNFPAEIKGAIECGFLRKVEVE